MYRPHALCMCALLLTGCSSNIKDTDVLSSKSVILPPATAKTVFLQNRNSSDNQAVTPSDLGSRLGAQGHQIVQDPNTATYVILTNIVYCNQTKVELPVEEMVASGYGSGIGSSIMGGLQGLTGIASMAGPQGAIIGTGASLGLNPISGIGSAVGGMFGGLSQPDANDDINYACVADLQITQHNKPGNSPLNAQSGASLPPGVYQTRMAASIHQKTLDEPEATPLLQDKLSAAVAGHF
jgi:TraT complement resistance protein